MSYVGVGCRPDEAGSLEDCLARLEHLKEVERLSDYVALLRDLAALNPAEALAQFDLDEAGYLELGRAWGSAIGADPTIAQAIAAGLAKR